MDEAELRPAAPARNEHVDTATKAAANTLLYYSQRTFSQVKQLLPWPRPIFGLESSLGRPHRLSSSNLLPIQFEADDSHSLSDSDIRYPARYLPDPTILGRLGGSENGIWACALKELAHNGFD